MTDNKNSFEDLKKLMVDRAFAEAESQLGQELPEPTEQHEFSARHNAEMQKFFKSMNKNNKKISARCKSMLKVAACFLGVVIIAYALQLEPVEAWRERIFNFVFESEQPNTDFRLGENKATVYTDDKIKLNYVPVGFEVSDKYYDNMQYIFSFKSNEYYFQIIITEADFSMSIDTENGEYEKIIIKDKEAIYTLNENINSVIFENDGKSVTVLGNISRADLIKIATNLKIRF